MADYVTNTSNSGDGDWFPGDEMVDEADGAQRQPSTEFAPPAEVDPEGDAAAAEMAERVEQIEDMVAGVDAVKAIVDGMANNVQNPVVSGDAPLATD